MNHIRKVIGLLSATVLMSFDPSQDIEFNRQIVRKKQKITVVVPFSQTTVTLGEGGDMRGPELDLLNEFAQYINLPIDLIVVGKSESPDLLIKKYQADIVAMGALNYDRANVLEDLSYLTVGQQMICNKRLQKGKPFTLYADNSQKKLVKKAKAFFPLAQIRQTAELQQEKLIQHLAKGKFDCAIVADNIAKTYLVSHSRLRTVHRFKKKKKLAWLVNKDNHSLKRVINNWFDQVADNGIMEEIQEKHYGHLADFDAYDIKVFQRRFRQRLPRYKKLFTQAESKYGISWELLAATAYQESHWNPRARSFTGVRGLMMLTLNTAKSLGVQNRLNPYQSVMGGAKYLKRLKDRLPAIVAEPDRTYLALAAYNVGFGHLEDAMNLASQMGKDPSRWKDVRTVLPLLSQRKFYQHLRYGRARGNEPVQYVARIRRYHEQILQIEAKKQPWEQSQEMRISLLALAE